MPFGLANAPAIFQNMINDILREYLDQGVLAYLDDILIYSKNMEEHVGLVKKVLQKLKENHLAVAAHKSIFHALEVEFLGHMINQEGLRMSERKVESITTWETPKNIKDIQRFLGFANYYRRYRNNFSALCRPLTDSLKKTNEEFECTELHQRSFDELKKAFTSEAILRHFNPSKEVIIETDASNFALGCILSQRHEGRLHPVAFHSRKMSPAERNYDIHDKETLAIVEAFKVWRHYCHGARTIPVYTDHNNLKYFMEANTLNGRQARWAAYLSQFDFKVIYRPGSRAGKPDALSRRSEYAVEEGEVPQTKIIQKFEIVATILTEKIKFKRQKEDATIPTQGSSQAAGLYLYSIEEKTVARGGRILVGTGITIGLPQGTYGGIAPRSGLESKAGISNDAGVIDREYTGEIKVLLVNNGPEKFQIRKGDRIAQIVIERWSLGEAMEVDSLEETERNSKGFGSTDNFFLFNNLRINELSLAGLHPEFKEKIRQAGKNDPIYQKPLEDEKVSSREGLIYVGTGRTYIPNNEKLKLEIAESEHDYKFARHFGRDKTLELRTRSFFWPKMEEWIRNYIRSCDMCQRNKSSRHAKYGLLNLWTLPTCYGSIRPQGSSYPALPIPSLL